MPKGIYKRKPMPEQQKINVGKALKGKMSGDKNPMFGKTPWNKGLTKETDDRVKKYVNSSSISRKGGIPWNKNKKGIYSEKTLKKMRNARIGKSLSEQTKIKISESLSGENNHFYGKHHTKEAIKKISGKNHYNWKGGITPLLNKIRSCFKMRQWVSDIFTRDDYTCQECGARNGNGKHIDLEAHHIKRFTDILLENNIKTFEEAIRCEELWNINNGITLCRKCHDKTK